MKSNVAFKVGRDSFSLKKPGINKKTLRNFCKPVKKGWKHIKSFESSIYRLFNTSWGPNKVEIRCFTMVGFCLQFDFPSGTHAYYPSFGQGFGWRMKPCSGFNSPILIRHIIINNDISIDRVFKICRKKVTNWAYWTIFRIHYLTCQQIVLSTKSSLTHNSDDSLIQL